MGRGEVKREGARPCAPPPAADLAVEGDPLSPPPVAAALNGPPPALVDAQAPVAAAVTAGRRLAHLQRQNRGPRQVHPGPCPRPSSAPATGRGMPSPQGPAWAPRMAGRSWPWGLRWLCTVALRLDTSPAPALRTGRSRQRRPYAEARARTWRPSLTAHAGEAGERAKRLRPRERRGPRHPVPLCPDTPSACKSPTQPARERTSEVRSRDLGQDGAPGSGQVVSVETATRGS